MDPRFFRKYADIITEAETQQLDEGAMETISNLVKKLPGFDKYYQMAQRYKPQLTQILQTSKSAAEVKQKMEAMVAQQSTQVAEAGLGKQLGGLGAMVGSVLSAMWMQSMGIIDNAINSAASGNTGVAVASGLTGVGLPLLVMLLGAMLMFDGARDSEQAKKDQFIAQRGPF